VADFSSWGPIELRVTLGDIVTAFAALMAAWWVGHIIQRRIGNERATKDLIASLCRESLATLNLLSDSIEVHCQVQGRLIEESVRRRLMRDLAIFSNSVLSIEVAIAEAKFQSCSDFMEALKSAREDLRPQVTDPMVATRAFDDSQLRSIQGSILKTRHAIVKLEINIMNAQ